MLLSAARRWLAPKSVAPARRAMPPRRLRVEGLEDRTVPATFTVGSGFATIQAALTAAAAHSGSDTVVVPAGTYTEALVVNDSSAVTLKANGAVTINAPADVTPVVLSGEAIGAAVIDIYGKNVTVDGFTVNGATGADGELYAGIRVIKGGSATVKNNTVTGMLTGAADSNIGIQVGTSRGPGSAGTAKVTNNTVTDYVGAGIMVDGAAASATVKGNTVVGRGLANLGIVQYGIQVSRGASARVESNAVSGNDTDGAVEGGSNPAPASAGILLYDVGSRDVVVAKNAVTGNDYGILVDESAATWGGGLRVVNNDVFGNTGYAGISARLSSGVEIVNNDVSDNTAWNGIALDESTHVAVKGNEVSGNPNADGIYVILGGHNEIHANNSFDNGYNGVFVDSSDANAVWNNFTHGNAENGIKVLGGAGNDLWLGASTCNSLDGILLQDTTGTTVVGNALLANGGYGLRLVNADNTYIALNLILDNAEGSIFIDADSTGVTTIANVTDTPPEREGTTGSAGSCWFYTTAHAHADEDCAGLED